MNLLCAILFCEDNLYLLFVAESSSKLSTRYFEMLVQQQALTVWLISMPFIKHKASYKFPQALTQEAYFKYI